MRIAAASLRSCLALALTFAAVLGLSACGDDCVDEDGDGFGRGCEPGPDCDDSRATRARDCSSPLPDCDANPYARGCACLTGERRECYDAAPESVGIAACRVGQQECPTGSWTACTGQIVPSFDICNDIDDDCDGVIDEAVRSPCGGCDAACTGGVWGDGPYPFEPGEGLALSALGELTLAVTPLQTRSVFVPNTGESTVSRIDPDTARETARYATHGRGPERIAIDYQGDAWVLDPSLEGRSMLTRIAADASRCVDRDGDGLETSRGPRELVVDDECVLLRRTIGERGEVARALAVSGARGPDDEDGGRIYVGYEHSRRVAELDATSGEELRGLELPGFAPYAAAIDPWGTLWLLDRAGLLARIEPGASELAAEILEAQLACYVLEALAIDAGGQITLTGASCESVARFDPARSRWQHVDAPGVLDARAVAVIDDASWVTHTAGRLSRITHSPFELVDTYSLAGDGVVPFESTAVSADSQGALWIVSSMGGEDDTGLVTRFDAESRQVTAQVPVGFLPRALGDLTGERRFGLLTPQAVATRIFQGCGRDGVTVVTADAGDVHGEEPLASDASMSGSGSGSGSGEAPTRWLRVHVPAFVDQGSSVLIEARHATSVSALDAASFVSLGELPTAASPLPLDFPDGGVVELRLTLRSRNYLGGPRVARVGLEWRCPGPD